MTSVSFDLPETVFSALRVGPQGFACEMRIAAAMKWYELGKVSQKMGAEIAGLSRSEFIDTLCGAKISLFQYTAEELEHELRFADRGTGQ